MIRIEPAVRSSISVWDAAEVYGLNFHLASAVELLAAACRTHPIDKRKMEKARDLLQRFIDDPHKCIALPSAEPHALKWNSPPKVIAALGLKDVPALVVTYILNAAAFDKNDACQLEIAKGLAALDTHLKETAS